MIYIISNIIHYMVVHMMLYIIDDIVVDLYDCYIIDHIFRNMIEYLFDHIFVDMIKDFTVDLSTNITNYMIGHIITNNCIYIDDYMIDCVTYLVTD